MQSSEPNSEKVRRQLKYGVVIQPYYAAPLEQLAANEHERAIFDDWLHGESVESLDRTPSIRRQWSNTAIVTACDLLDLHKRADVLNVLAVIDYALDVAEQTGIPFDDVIDSVFAIHLKENQWNKEIRRNQTRVRRNNGNRAQVFYQRMCENARVLRSAVFRRFVVFAAKLRTLPRTLSKDMRDKLTGFGALFIRATAARDCPVCSGTGHTSAEVPEACSACDGTGKYDPYDV